MNKNYPLPLFSLEFLAKNKKRLKNVVLAGGVFDIVHAGHVAHLKKAKSYGKTLIIHIPSDKRVREKKGDGRPVFSQEKRALLVEAIRFVDYVFIHDGRHYDQEVIDAVKPDIILFNKEAYSEDVKEKIKNLKNFKGKVIVSDEEKIDSTSGIIERIKNGSSSLAPFIKTPVKHL